MVTWQCMGKTWACITACGNTEPAANSAGTRQVPLEAHLLSSPGHRFKALLLQAACFGEQTCEGKMVAMVHQVLVQAGLPPEPKCPPFTRPDPPPQLLAPVPLPPPAAAPRWAAQQQRQPFRLTLICLAGATSACCVFS